VTLADTLDRAAADAERGDLGKARDRLQGLLAAYPSELEIRRRLGELYWRLQYPERAGQYWYLVESESPDMDAAKRAFEARHGADPWLMLDAIGFHGGLDSIEGTYAEVTIRDLAKRAGVTQARLEAALRKRGPGDSEPPDLVPWWVRLIPAGLVGALILILLFALVGAVTAIGWLWRLLSS